MVSIVSQLCSPVAGIVAVAGGWCSYFPLVFVLCLWDLSFVDVTTGSTRFCV